MDADDEDFRRYQQKRTADDELRENMRRKVALFRSEYRIAAVEATPARAEVEQPIQPHWGPARAFAVFGVYLAAQLGAAVIVGFLGVFAVAFFSAAAGKPADPTTILSKLLVPTVFLTGLFSAGVAIGFSLIHGRGRVFASGPENFGVVRPTLGSLRIAALGGLLLSATFSYLVPKVVPAPPLEAFGPMTRAVTRASTTADLNQWLWIIYALLAAPITEEYVFRGVLASGLRRRFRPLLAGTIVTFIFTALHLTETSAYWPAVISVAALGAWTFLLRERTGSLVPAICAHFSYNFVICFQLFIASH